MKKITLVVPDSTVSWETGGKNNQRDVVSSSHSD